MSQQDSRQKSCAERIDDHLRGRLQDFAELVTLAGHYGEPTDEIKALAESQDLDVDDSSAYAEIGEQAQERIYEYPLGLSTYKVHRIDLSTGGPGDWLEVFVNDSAIDRIVYHFNDWFDHAETTLSGADFDAAESFVMALIPELD